MLAGHFAAGLIAKQQVPKGSLLYFLVMSQLPDLLWVVFHFLGLEHTEPSNFTAVSLDNLMVNMMFSHDLISILGWSVVAFVIGWLLFKDTTVGLAGSALIAVHALTDYLGGYPHNVFGPDSMEVGTGLYYSSPYLGVLFEAVFTSIALWLFFRHEKRTNRKRTKKNQRGIIFIFVFGLVFILSIADLAMTEAMGFAPPNFPFATTMPFMVMLYGGLLYFIHRTVSKPYQHA